MNGDSKEWHWLSSQDEYSTLGKCKPAILWQAQFLPPVNCSVLPKSGFYTALQRRAKIIHCQITHSKTKSSIKKNALKPEGLPLTKIEKCTVEMREMIQLPYLFPKRIYQMDKRMHNICHHIIDHSQSTLLSILSKHTVQIRTASKTSLPSTKSL